MSLPGLRCLGTSLSSAKCLIGVQQFSILVGYYMTLSTHMLIPPQYPVPSKHHNAFPPTLHSGVQFYVEGERIGLASGYWWNVILVSVDKCDDLHSCLLQR